MGHPMMLQGRYQVESILKQGGMGRVYRARDAKLAGSTCAVKEILQDKQADTYFQTRFVGEMRALARLDHPSIPRIRDFFRDDASSYLVMDLVEGDSLEDELEHQGVNSASRTVRDMLQVLEVLEYLHGQHPPVIHRDIKPANLLREHRTGRIKVVDFGLARTSGVAEMEKTAVGTVGYCAPEQIYGRADPRSDLFAVGATMLHLLTGEPCSPLAIFSGTELEFPHLPTGLLAILQKATQFMPSQRFATAREMAVALDAWLVEHGHRHHLSSSRWRLGVEQPRPTAVPAPPVQEPGRPTPRRWPTRRVAVGLLLCGVLGGFRGTPTTIRPSPSPTLEVKPPVAVRLIAPGRKKPRSLSVPGKVGRASPGKPGWRSGRPLSGPGARSPRPHAPGAPARRLEN